jgi:Family of unknown function (DUF5994)
MSVPTLSFETTQARRWTIANPRLRLKPEHGSAGFVQGGWWPRTDQLHTELPLLLAALSSRSGTVDRVIYDENSWAPASLRMEFRGHSVILESTNTSDNTLTVLGNQFGTLVLLVVPPDADPGAARTAVMTAANPDDGSTAEELLRIGMRGQEGRQASMTQQRDESDGEGLRRRGARRYTCVRINTGTHP